MLSRKPHQNQKSTQKVARTIHNISKQIPSNSQRIRMNCDMRDKYYIPARGESNEIFIEIIFLTRSLYTFKMYSYIIFVCLTFFYFPHKRIPSYEILMERSDEHDSYWIHKLQTRFIWSSWISTCVILGLRRVGVCVQGNEQANAVHKLLALPHQVFYSVFRVFHAYRPIVSYRFSSIE